MTIRLHFILLLIFSLFVNQSLFAQKRNSDKVNLKYDSLTVKGNATDFEIVTHNTVYNPTANSMTYRWVVVSKSLATGWSFAFCDPSQCIEADSSEFTLAAGDSGTFETHFYPNGKSGNGSLSILVFPVSTPYKDTKLAYSKCVVEPGSASVPVKLDFSMYPNPARDYLDIRFTKKGNHTIEVYNVLGTRLIKKDAFNTDRIRISLEEFQNGMYVILYRSDNGKVITKTVSKE